MKRILLFLTLATGLWLSYHYSESSPATVWTQPSATQPVPTTQSPYFRSTPLVGSAITQLKPNRVDDDEEDADDEVMNRSSEEMISSLSIVTPSPVATMPTSSSTPSSAATPGAGEKDAITINITENSQDQRDSRSRGGPPLFPVRSAQSEDGDPTPEPATTPTSDLPRVSGQPRGYAMLYLMQPQARATVEKEVQILLDSQVQDLYLSTLVDGTFTQDFEYLNSIIKRLNTDNRTLTLALYFVSGPTMRRFEHPYVETAFSNIDPAAFRFMVESDSETRRSVLSLAEKARSSLELNRTLNNGNQSFAIPMLEDNLDLQSYRVMRSLLGSVLNNTVNFIRNPCLGCYEGNDSGSAGDPMETHNLDEFQTLQSGDAFTMDGNHVAYPGEATGGKISIETLQTMLEKSVSQNHLYFGLWRAQRQGNRESISVAPDQRTYEIPSEEHRLIEIELLRRGLTPVQDDSSDDGIIKLN